MRRYLLILSLIVPAAYAAGSSFESEWLGSQRSFQSLANHSPLPISGEGLGERVDTSEFSAAEDEPGIPPDLLAEGARWNTKVQLARIPEQSAGPLNFTVIGDAEPGRFIWSRVLFGKKGVFVTQLRRIEGEDSAFVMQLGDMVSRGIPRNYRRFYDDLNESRLSKPFLSVIGNHDRRSPHGRSDADLYEGLFGPLDYSFDDGGARFVVLDTSQEFLSAEQLAWLDKVLRTDKRKFVFTHMPPVHFKSWTLGVTGIREGGDEFVKLMAERKVDRVYMGHIHGYGIAQRDGVRYVLSGGGGSPLYLLLPSGGPKLFYHYITVALDADGIHETVHPLEGAPFEIAWPKVREDFDLLIEGQSGLVAGLPRSAQ